MMRDDEDREYDREYDIRQRDTFPTKCKCYIGIINLKPDLQLKLT